MPGLIAVDYDPFAPQEQGGGPRLVPVDHDPFAPASPRVSRGEAALEGGLAGASANFRDEIYGASRASGLPEILGGLRAPIGAARLAYEALSGQPGEATRAYEAGRDTMRARAAEARSAYPGTFLASELAGGLLPAGTALKAIGPGASLGGTILRSAGAGAASGTVSGLGAGEGDAANQITTAGFGAGLGFGSGLAAPVVGQVAGKVAQRIINGRPTVSGQAAKQVADIAARDAIPAEEMAGRVAALGPEGMIADLGPNLTQRAAVLAATPGEAQKIIRSRIAARQAGAGERVEAATDTALGAKTNLTEAEADIIARRAQTASPLYEAAYAKPLPQSNVIANILRTPAGREAVAQAQRLSQNEGIQLDPNSVRGVDLIKRVFDDMAASAGRSGKNNEARVIGSLRDRLVAEADRAAPEYAEARNVFASESALLDALAAGREVFKSKITPDVLRVDLRKMTEGEREAFMQGARGAVANFMGTGRSDAAAARSLFARGYNREKLALIVGDEGARDMVQTLNREAARAATANRVTANSETASRVLGAGDRAIGSLPTSAREVAMTLLDKAVRAVRSGRRDEIDAAVADILTSTSPARNGLLTRVLKEAAAQDRSGAVVRRIRNQATGLQLGGTVPLAQAPLEAR